ncbi:MAG: GNAT family N-acetyltransferase [Proteobacteria bacterium]|nr:GNAT family N-acetyltransferase [Pseudomonadota bacterium]
MMEIQYDIFIKGNLIDLVCLNESIALNSNWYNWFNDEENMYNMQKHYFPSTRESQVNFFRTVINNSATMLQVGIFHKKDQILIGVISLSKIDYLNRKCEISGFIGEKKYQNIQNFLEANRLLICHAFEQLNMNRIYGGAIKNEIAELYLRSLGFTREGLLVEDVYKNGMYNDVHLIAISQKRYNEFFKKNDDKTNEFS